MPQKQGVKINRVISKFFSEKNKIISEKNFFFSTLYFFKL